MVKDLRRSSEKGNIQQGLAEVVDEVTQGEYGVSRKSPKIRLSDGRKEPDLYIHYKILLDIFNDCRIIDSISERIMKLGKEPIEVYIKSEEDILFKVPKGDTLGLKIAEAYEKKFGKEVITIESLPDPFLL